MKTQSKILPLALSVIFVMLLGYKKGFVVSSQANRPLQAAKATLNPAAQGVAITFAISSGNTGITDFSLWINGSNVSGPRGVSETNPIHIDTDDGGSTSATVQMQVSFGYMPVSATLYGAGAPINGVIAGSNVTFSGANISTAGTYYIVID